MFFGGSASEGAPASQPQGPGAPGQEEWRTLEPLVYGRMGGDGPLLLERLQWAPPEHCVKVYLSTVCASFPPSEHKTFRGSQWAKSFLAHMQGYGGYSPIRTYWTRGNDIILVYENQVAARTIINKTRLSLSAPERVWRVPVGPVVAEGEINWERYAVSVTVPVDIEMGELIQKMKELGHVLEVVPGHQEGANTADSGATFYLRLENEAHAATLPRSVEIAEHTIYLRHKMNLMCGTCHSKGHKQEDCARIARKKRKQAAYRQNRQLRRN